MTFRYNIAYLFPLGKRLHRLPRAVADGEEAAASLVSRKGEESIEGVSGHGDRPGEVVLDRRGGGALECRTGYGHPAHRAGIREGLCNSLRAIGSKAMLRDAPNQGFRGAASRARAYRVSVGRFDMSRPFSVFQLRST